MSPSSTQSSGSPAGALLAWYRRHRRRLPWRGTRDPYRIWVAEVMLQQTRVETVLRYYRRFLARFATVHELAAAELGEVLRLWEGLGYYARARNLHRAAGMVVRQGWPATLEGWRRLPGVGACTAAALASRTLGTSAPALDGNARRVYARLFGLERGGERELRSRAEGLLPPDRAGEFNQAIMELGATLCLPRRPGCPRCPLASLCRARALGLQETIPGRRRRPVLPHWELAAAVVERDGRLLLARRPEDGLLGGLWEFPTRPGREAGEPLATVKHAYSHLRTTTRAYRLPEADLSGYEEAAWLAPQELDGYPLTRVARRIAATLQT